MFSARFYVICTHTSDNPKTRYIGIKELKALCHSPEVSSVMVRSATISQKLFKVLFYKETHTTPCKLDVHRVAWCNNYT